MIATTLTTPEKTTSEKQPLVAIVIPLFKHSVLVSEAITCAVAQSADFPLVTIIVNDGCPFKETDQVCRDFALAYPDQVFYLNRQNGGLSAARNTGIDFALTTWDSIQAIYFLDADNRISPQTIAKAFQCLLDNPAVGWIYPDIHMFGEEHNFDYGGEYSRLIHLKVNICEAGSLVRRQVFEAGCRYDEDMKLGFEDWEFWWQALDVGFIGRHLPEFGFQYRKRPESMLKNSDRDKQGIVHYMERKHKKLLTHRHVINLEHQEAPRYAIFLSDLGKVILTSDPTVKEHTVSVEEFRELYQRAKIAPTQYHRPHFLIFTRSRVLQCLEEQGLSRWTFWRLEGASNQFNFANLNLAFHSESRIISQDHQDNFKHQVGLTDYLIITTINLMDACLNDPQEDWINSLLSSKPLPTIFNLGLVLPYSQSSEILSSGALYSLMSIYKDLRLNYQNISQKSWNWHTTHLPQRSLMFDHVRSLLNSGAVYPILHNSNKKQMGFLLPLVEFGGVEKVALNIAKVFHDSGWAVHLFVFNQEIAAIPEWGQVFETINFLHDPKMYQFGGPKYMGTFRDHWSISGDHSQAIGLLGWLDVLVNFHSVAANSIMGPLRRAGVKTAISLHVHDLSPWGRPVGFTHVSLGYEHAYNYIIPCSHQMGDWCHSMGVPEDKIVVLPNACGYPLEDTLKNEILARKWEQRPHEGLNVLFIGRFDRQKGLDRLLGIVNATRHLDLPIQWRLVGKNVIQHEDAASELDTISDLIEPPIFDNEGLNEVYEWADVLIVPSYWEGLPLTILEAMRLGVVPCAADVGAVSEAIIHGQTGFLVPNLQGGGFVPIVIKYLSDLSENPVKLQQMSQKAALVAQKRSWEQSCAKLREILEDSGKG